MEYLAYFVLGIGLNLTPCVYPMLTITLSLFRSSEDEGRGKVFGKACIYVLGIAVMFTSLGVAAAMTGGFFGAWLRNFWVLFLLGVFIIALSFSMFGFYTFRLPSWLLPQGGTSGKSLLGFFLSGLLVGVVAAPCMGPVVLSLLTTVGQSGDVVRAATVFLALSLGLGFPYLVLGTFTGLLKELPKSGAWLLWFERLLGVVLFTLGCFYILIALRISGALAWLAPLAWTLGGVYLGWFEDSAKGMKKFTVFQRLTGSVAAVSGLIMIVGLLAPHSVSMKNKMAWEKYRPGILAEAREASQPVVLDFYADWCIPCHELEKYTFGNARVIAALEGFRKVRVDATYPDDVAVQELAGKYGVYGVPTVIFLDREGREVEEMRVSGFIEADELLPALKRSRLGK